MARRLLVRGAEVLVTMDGERREIAGGDVLIDGGVIAAVGTDLSREGAEVVEAAGCVVTPGLVNTHHHLFQTLTRAVPAAQDAALFGWLRTLYPIWSRMRPEDIRLSARIGLAELALSGCTCSSDHLYVFPNGARLDDSVEAAAEVGIRFHATRGAMSIGESKGGLPPDALVEEAAILRDSERVVAAFHHPEPGAMVQVALAPCSPFSVSRELMRDAAILAREKGVRLHTHLAENDEDVAAVVRGRAVDPEPDRHAGVAHRPDRRDAAGAYSLENFGMLPGDYAESVGWTGEDVWHAHCVKLSAGEIDLFARTGTGVAHCPCSNARLGAREALEIATRGGARVLGRSDLGSIEPGKRADLVLWDVSDLPAAGQWDPVAALVFCAPVRPRAVYVRGRAVVQEGRLAGLDPARLTAEARAAVARLAG